VAESDRKGGPPGPWLRGAALALTFATGFAALVDEVAWQRALAVLLGSHGEATSAVLAIFLGGLALGYALFGRWSRRRTRRARLLRAYGAAEIGVGLWALAFPTLFAGARALSVQLRPASAGLDLAGDLALTVALLGPPTVLMGATLPLLTQALARDLPDASRIHALVYGTNAAGGFLGAWAAGLWALPTLGIDGALRALGVVSLAAGAAFLALARHAGPDAAPAAPPRAAGARPTATSPSHAAAACLIGFAMIALQTVWVRVAALAFGSSDLTFAIVAGVFVLCIATGSLAVAALPRVPRAAVVAAPAAVAVLLAALDPALPTAPYFAHHVRLWAGLGEGAQLRFELGAAALCLAVGLLPLGLAGASLPLLFHALRRRMDDLGDVVGRLYGWNTLGSVLGALLGGYLLLLRLDLQDVHRVAIGALALAAGLLARAEGRRSRAAPVVAIALAALVAFALPDWDPRLLSAGYLRLREPTDRSHAGPRALAEAQGATPVFAADDPVTTVLVSDHRTEAGEISRALYTQGKSDGSLLPDYPTMALTGLVPCALARRCESAFVIGLGTGVTAGELAEVGTVGHVVVSEISRAVIEALPLFDHGNRGASRSPKIEIVASDAYRTLLGRDDRFDVIASEPSHPWASGVERLYAVEFLRAARERLAPGGVYAQWMHAYEMDDATLALVLRTFAAAFERTAVWYARGPDLLLLGWADAADGHEATRLRARAARPDVAAGLARADVAGLPELIAHELIPPGVITAEALPGPLHTLLRPRLAHGAGRAFFYDRRARLPRFLSDAARARGRAASVLAAEPPRDDATFHAIVDETCGSRGFECAAWIAAWRHARPDSPGPERAREAWSDLHAAHLLPERIDLLASLFGGGRPGLGARDARRVTDHYVAYYLHGQPFSRAALERTWAECLGEGCAAGRRAALARLDAPSTSAQPPANDEEAP
jgi:spermidine synthase